MTTTAPEAIDPLVLDLLADPTVVAAVEKAFAIERRIAAIRAEPFPAGHDPEPIKRHRYGTTHNLRLERNETLTRLHERLGKMIEQTVRDAGGAR